LAREAAAKAKREAKEAEMKATAAREAAQAEREAAEQAASAAQEEIEPSADQILEPMALAVVHATDPIQQTPQQKGNVVLFSTIKLSIVVFLCLPSIFSLGSIPRSGSTQENDTKEEGVGNKSEENPPKKKARKAK
jgi:hypothetical protein